MKLRYWDHVIGMGQVTIKQYVFCPNAFQLEHQFHGMKVLHECNTSWRAMAIAKLLAHPRGTKVKGVL